MVSEAQWIPQASGFSAPSRGIKYMCAVDTNVVWATAYDGSVTGAPEVQEFTRTTNGGTKWKADSIPGYTGWGLSMITAVDSMNAWVPMWNPAGGGTILRTSDGGQTWTPQTTAVFDGPAGFPNVAHFWDLNNGFCMGDPNGGYFEIYTTTDGGTTWNRVPSGDIPPELSNEWGTTGLYCVVGDFVWFTTGKGRVYKSIDRGYHWTVSATLNTTEQMQISFRDYNNGIVQVNTAPYDAFYTTDGGTTWQQLMPAGNFYANDFCYIPGTTSTYISTGSDINNSLSGVSYSVDDGAIWDLFIGSDSGQFLAVDFVDVKHGWVGAFNLDNLNGGMWKYVGNDFVFDSCAGFAAMFSKSTDTLDLNISGQVDFTDMTYGDPTSWDWNFGDAGTSTSQDPSHTYSAVGSFNVTLSSSKGTCNSVYSEIIVVLNTAGITKTSADVSIEMWPNPASDYLNISSATTIGKVEIYNSLGLNVLVTEISNLQSRIDLSAYLPGVYFISITTEQGRTEGRFLINR